MNSPRIVECTSCASGVSFSFFESGNTATLYGASLDLSRSTTRTPSLSGSSSYAAHSTA